MGRQKFIVIDYSNEELVNTDKEPVHFVDFEGMLKWIEKSHRDETKIAIYKVGDCIMDWS